MTKTSSSNTDPIMRRLLCKRQGHEIVPVAVETIEQSAFTSRRNAGGYRQTLHRNEWRAWCVRCGRFV